MLSSVFCNCLTEVGRRSKQKEHFSDDSKKCSYSFVQALCVFIWNPSRFITGRDSSGFCCQIDVKTGMTQLLQENQKSNLSFLCWFSCSSLVDGLHRGDIKSISEKILILPCCPPNQVVVKSNIFANTAIRFVQGLPEARLLKSVAVPFWKGRA